ncbi:MAG: excinuclease ABC subunit UvrA [Planctomycetaceae bacterium]|jgi:excinuclease ABC subunit A|nr:excinuclease ABC subunit UvrA [Planctomycetaceae bacterium]
MSDIIVNGAREHNLCDVDLVLPRNKLICFTGVSGSGKSSLAFDTLYAEGQRRYVESLSSYARQFLGQLPKPDVDQIRGLSPSISISQKSGGQSVRSTVGTITEIYDFLRVLFARVATGYCPRCGKPISAQTRQQIIDQIEAIPESTHLLIMSPVVRKQKGEFKDLFSDLSRQGYTRARVDGQVVRLNDDLKLDRQMRHDIEVIVDRIVQSGAAGRNRLSESVERALAIGGGHIIIASDFVELAQNNQQQQQQQPNPNLNPAQSKRKKNSNVNFPDQSELDRDSFSVTKNQTIELSLSANYACTDCNISFEPPSPQLFSFNTPRGMCPKCDGLGEVNSFDPDLLIPDKSKSFQQGCIVPIGRWRDLGRWRRHIFQGVAEALEKFYNLQPHTVLETAWEELDPKIQSAVLWGTGDWHITYTWHNTSADHKWGGQYAGIIPQMLIQFKETKSKMQRLEMEKYMRVMNCNFCNGERLNEQARAFKLETACDEFKEKKLSLPQLCKLPINSLQKFFSDLVLSDTGKKIAAEALKEIRNRLGFLVNVGLEYLSLGRTAPTLSGGEMQRIRLASQIGSGLVGVLYILDEPSIGLHPRDNDRLLATLAKLRDLGNTVIVVEHDEDTMRAADMLVDFGPGPGIHGGKIVSNILGIEKINSIKLKTETESNLAESNLTESNLAESNSESITLKYLSGIESIPIPQRRRQITDRKIIIRGAGHNNLKNIDVEIPLGVFVCVTGVSGSGKSSLINDILVEGLNRDLNRGYGNPGFHRSIDGIELLDKMIDIDQSPIGRGSHSNPATYIKVFDEIRNLFAEIPEAKLNGYEPGRFSFNIKGGRCEACEGRGVQKLEMDFLADVYVTCQACQGRRFNHETLAIRYKGKSIDQVLNMDVEEAIEHFENHPKIKHYLSMLARVGLGYMKLGQPSPTLSGGEAQRIKLARELVKRSTGKTLYLLDEPTTGLHFADIKMLLGVLHEFVEAGNTVLVVEHNLDVIKTADWIIDLGPEGGEAGGEIVTTGAPEMIVQCENSHTGKALKKYFDKKNAAINTVPPIIPITTTQKKSQLSQSQLTQSQNSQSPNNAASEINSVIVCGAEEHNLKNVSVEIPRDKMTVCSGPSGSGKSSLAMDTIYAEGQRRYVESLSSYARQFIGQLQKPRVERIEGLSPAIAIEQKSASHSPRSTVGTITEVQDYLRVLFARLGVSYCPDCNIPVGTQTLDEIIAKIMSMQTAHRLLIAAPVTIEVGQIYDELWRRFRADGFSRVRVDGVLYSLDGTDGLPDIDRRRRHDVELIIDRIVLRDDQSGRMRIADSVESALLTGRGVVHVIEADESIPETRWKRSIHSQHLACERCGRSFERLTPHHFSANSPLGWCPNCEGLGVQRGANPAVFLCDSKLTLWEGAVNLLPNTNTPIGAAMLRAFAEQTGIPLNTPFEQLDARHRRLIYHGTGDQEFNVKFEINLDKKHLDKNNETQKETPKETIKETQKNIVKKASKKVTPAANSVESKIIVTKNNKTQDDDADKNNAGKNNDIKDGDIKDGGDVSGVVGREVQFSFQYKGLYNSVEEASRLVPMFRVEGGMVLDEVECGVCMGSRLRDDVSAVRLIGYTMDQLCRLPLGVLIEVFRGWKLTAVERQVAGDLLVEVVNRLQFLIDVGLDYLTLSRPAPTLSGGETQRIRLAAQIGSGLVGVLYVLDEPTIGLHPRDNMRLIEALRKLRDLGNTLIVVEHDKDVILGADKILDFGPKAGRYGGEIVAQGAPEQILKQKNSVTGAYLNGKKQIPIPKNRRISIKQSKKSPTKQNAN